MKTKPNLHLLFIYSVIFFASSTALHAQDQDRISIIAARLDSMANFIPGLRDKTSISLRDVPIADYVRAIGINHKVNVYIEDAPETVLTTHLTDESVSSVFLFICSNFNYDIKISGGILIFLPWKPTPDPKTPPSVNTPLIALSNGLLSCDLKNDSLYAVIKTISSLTGKKLIAHPGSDGLLTAYLPPTHPDTAIRAIFATNGYRISNRHKGFQVIYAPVTDEAYPQKKGINFSVEAFSDAEQQYLAVDADNTDLGMLIRAVFEELNQGYLIYTQLEGSVTLHAEIARLNDLLKSLLAGTEYTFRKEGDIYLVGLRETPAMNTTRVVTLRHRPSYQVMDLIPGAEPGEREMPMIQPVKPVMTTRPYDQDFGQESSGLFNPGITVPQTHTTPPQINRLHIGMTELIEYPELNRIILRGPMEEVDEIEDLLLEIDLPVPMVKVEMIVVEVNKNRLIQTGIEARWGGGEDSASVRSLFPGLDFSANGDQINQLLSNIPGLRPIGLLDQNFHLTLQALESQGNVKVRMKPVLSMLNGRESSLTIGQTQYFLLETQTASTGAVSNFQQFSQRFERIDANITLSIKPYISEGEMVTLDIIPDFTTPVGAFDADVPPTIATRRFISSIRVKNGETVILGGLSQEESSENTSGVPFLSRIPVLKYLFGNVDKNKTSSSLLIYLTPTIQYQ
ncbi:MAG: hypothetical protein R3C61_00910 [Bacteroidia bacterium]